MKPPKTSTRYALWIPLAALIVTLCGTTLYACNTSKGEVVEPSTTQVEPPPEPPKAKPDPVPQYVDAFAGRFDHIIRSKMIEKRALDLIHKEAKQARAARYDNFHYRSILKQNYVTNAPKHLRFFHGDQLSEVGNQVVHIFENIGYHGLKPRTYHMRKIRKALAKLALIEAERDPSDRITLTDEHRTLLEDTIRSQKLDLHDPATEVLLVRTLLDPQGAAPPLTDSLKSMKAHAAKVAEPIADTEMYLLDGVSKYAWDMHYKNPFHVDPDGLRDRAEDEREKDLTERLRKELNTRLQDEDIPTLMRSLVPWHTQYNKLLPHLARYRKIVEDGGWKKLKATSGLKPGRSSATVKALKKRLSLEGYYTGSIDTQFDDSLTQAILAYQKYNQLEETGLPDKRFWHSVRVPAKEKMELIAITLDRWRESRIRKDDDYYVLVNIPDFHAEVWRDGERLTRFKVITGNTDMGCDLASGRWIRINATPIQSGHIENVIVNPWWSIPSRIMREEILPAAKDNPDYYKEKNIQCIRRDGDKCVKARQSSGGKNPLGQVKFIFPNIHNTFLHDTPHKRWFIFPRRAYSHGCMRLEKPLHLAQVLLENDESWNQDEWDRRLKRGVEYTFKLNRPVRIHVDYYSHRVDEEGQLWHLTDVYNHDRYRRRGKKFEPRKCRNEELIKARTGGI